MSELVLLYIITAVAFVLYKGWACYKYNILNKERDRTEVGNLRDRVWELEDKVETLLDTKKAK